MTSNEAIQLAINASFELTRYIFLLFMQIIVVDGHYSNPSVGGRVSVLSIIENT